ncbi:hypothetical protein [Streptomyces sp. FIT100]|nr:hypothetical protein [Streptomyces sp. FIT100]
MARTGTDPSGSATDWPVEIQLVETGVVLGSREGRSGADAA